MENIRRIAFDVGVAVYITHVRHNIVHMDIRPENVFFVNPTQNVTKKYNRKVREFYTSSKLVTFDINYTFHLGGSSTTFG